MKNDHVIESAKDSAQSIVSNDEQMLELSRRKEKIEQIKIELDIVSECEIIEDTGEFYIVGMDGQKYRINLELREKLPKSYFYSPDYDDDIVGYNAFTGSIIYNLWTLGKTEMMMSEGIHSDFHDTGYGIGRHLSYENKCDLGDKIPPTVLLSPNFINFHQKLQGSLYYWGYDSISLVNDIGVKEHQRLVLRDEIKSNKKSFEEYGHTWTEEHQNSHLKEMQRLEKKYQELVKGDLSDLPF